MSALPVSDEDIQQALGIYDLVRQATVEGVAGSTFTIPQAGPTAGDYESFDGGNEGKTILIPGQDPVVIRPNMVRDSIALQWAVMSKWARGEWRNLSLQNGWATYSASTIPQQRLCGFGRTVHLRGAIAGGSVPSICGVLDPDKRPTRAHTFAVPSNNAFGQVTVDPDGTVVVQVGNATWVRLDGVCFSLD